jgi:hypothetical protein
MSLLITPDDLAVELETFDLFSGEYSHDLQRNVGLDPRMTGTGTVTFGGTRSYNASGMPSDSDQDNDRSA